MRTASRLGIVLAGYVGASFVAWMALQMYVASTPAVDRSTGMSAFGDGSYYLAAFGVAAIPVTGLALFFLRPVQAFWRALSILSLAMMLITLAAAGANIWHGASSSPLVALSPLWLIATPLFAGSFLLSALLAPSRRDKLALFCACALQSAAFASVMLWWAS